MLEEGWVFLELSKSAVVNLQLICVRGSRVLHGSRAQALDCRHIASARGLCLMSSASDAQQLWSEQRRVVDVFSPP